MDQDGCRRLECIYWKYRDPVWKTVQFAFWKAGRSGDPAIEDVVQTTFLEFASTSQNVVDGPMVGAYLVKLARWRAADWLAANRRCAPGREDVAGPAGGDPAEESVEEIAIRWMRIAELRPFVRLLTRRQAVALWLRVGLRVPRKEVARRLGVTERRVSGLVAEAIEIITAAQAAQ